MRVKGEKLNIPPKPTMHALLYININTCDILSRIEFGRPPLLGETETILAESILCLSSLGFEN